MLYLCQPHVHLPNPKEKQENIFQPLNTPITAVRGDAPIPRARTAIQEFIWNFEVGEKTHSLNRTDGRGCETLLCDPNTACLSRHRTVRMVELGWLCYWISMRCWPSLAVCLGQWITVNSPLHISSVALRSVKVIWLKWLLWTLRIIHKAVSWWNAWTDLEWVSTRVVTALFFLWPLKMCISHCVDQ